MKIDRREMTLNERDSVLDMLTAEKALLNEYCMALVAAKRKEVRTLLVERMTALADEVFLLTDLLTGIEGE